MDSLNYFKQKVSENLSRSLLSSPKTYELAKSFFLRNKNYPFTGLKMITELALEQTASAYRRENKVGFVSAFFPDELLHAFGFTPFAPEVAAAIAASLDISPGLLKKSEKEEISPNNCSFHRVAAMGTYEDYLPIPDVFLASTHLCDGAPQLFRNLAEYYNKPYFVLDVPFYDDENSRQYVASQLEDIVTQLEKITGSSLTKEKLEETIHLSNKAREAKLELYEARKNPTKYLSGEDAITLVFLHFLGQGHPKTPEIYNTLTREIIAPKKEEENNTKELNNNSIRLIWSHFRPFFNNNLFEILEELNAKIVYEEMNYVYWPELDPKEPYLSLAKKVLSNPIIGPIERRGHSLKRMTRDFNAQGIIHFSHWGCRPTIGGVFTLKKMLKNENIPFTVIESDCVDKGKYSEGQLRTRLESFLEMLN